MTKQDILFFKLAIVLIFALLAYNTYQTTTSNKTIAAIEQNTHPIEWDYVYRKLRTSDKRNLMHGDAFGAGPYDGTSEYVGYLGIDAEGYHTILGRKRKDKTTK